MHRVEAMLISVGMGPPLKKYCFRSSGRVCIYITAECEPFFFILQKKNNFGSKFHHFLTKNKIKGLRPPDWPQFRPPAGQETNFCLRVAWWGRGIYRHEGRNVEGLDWGGGGGRKSHIFRVDFKKCPCPLSLSLGLMSPV